MRHDRPAPESGNVATRPQSFRAADTSPSAAHVDGTEAVAAVAATPADEESGNANWPDESAESAFLSEARERGEPVIPAKAREEIADETDAKALPSLDELVQRIPAEVREALDDLFRARFTTVKRIPRKALKDESRNGS